MSMTPITSSSACGGRLRTPSSPSRLRTPTIAAQLRLLLLARRRATARRASNRRATARSRQGDTEASIIEFLARHPGSTAGDLAKGLNLNPASVSTRLTQLSKAGEIRKAPHGYSTKQATQEY
jgi:CRP-like cAMP-binding protein